MIYDTDQIFFTNDSKLIFHAVFDQARRNVTLCNSRCEEMVTRALLEESLILYDWIDAKFCGAKNFLMF